MKKTDFNSATDEELIRKFEELAVVRGKLRTAKEANRAFDDSVAVWSELHRRGPQAIAMFLNLLGSSNPSVRLAVAANALFVAPEKAEPVLEQLTTEPRSLGVSAYMTLREWKAGRLKSLI